MKEVRVIFSKEAREVYSYLKQESSKTERTILNAINQKKGLIKEDFHYGEPVAKNLIPKEYKEKYSITNLFWVSLPNYWRMLYTLTNKEIEIIAFVLDIMNHKEYNKKFGYKKK